MVADVGPEMFYLFESGLWTHVDTQTQDHAYIHTLIEGS